MKMGPPESQALADAAEKYARSHLRANSCRVEVFPMPTNDKEKTGIPSWKEEKKAGSASRTLRRWGTAALVLLIIGVAARKLLLEPKRPAPQPQIQTQRETQPVDLGPFYNARLERAWLRPDWRGNHLANVPQGPQILGGISFDVYGLVQLQGAKLLLQNPHFPTNQVDIPINRLCQRLHILHGCAWSATDGTPIALLVIKYTDDSTQDLQIRYGQHVRDFYQRKPSNPPGPGSELAWVGTNGDTKGDERVRLYRSTFLNPSPEKAVRALDYVSLMSSVAPFLVALSVD